jgi:hydrophobe/amphiphile efflux-3 (HAE3) family protein
MVVEPALVAIPQTEGEIEVLKESLRGNPLIMGSVMSHDFTTAPVIVYLDSLIDELATLMAIDSVLQAFPGRAEVLKGGLPYIRAAILDDVKRDGAILVPLALVIMLVLLRLAFREWRGVIIPFSIVIMSMSVAMGLPHLFGWKLSVISLLVPVMMIAIANNYGIHLIARYQEIDNSGAELSVRQIVTKLLGALRKPVVLTGLTTIAGVLGLLTHSIIPARQVGILTAIGIGYALLLSLLFIPAWLSYLPRPVKIEVTRRSASPDGSSGFLHRIARYVTTKAKSVVFVSILITVVLGTGIIFLKVDSNQENFFPDSHPVKRASIAINRSFGGSQSISVLVEADILDPDNMQAIDQWCNSVSGKPGVGSALSIATVIREMSKALFLPEETYHDSIPGSREALAQMVEIYNMSGDPDDFSPLVDLNYTRAHIMIRFSNPSARNIRRVLLSAADFKNRIDGTVLPGGYAYIMDEFSGRIVKGQIYSILSALATILVLLIMIFRSLKIGLIATLPIVASIIILLGIMGWTGIPIDPATALLSSIMIGVGVDYTIHFIWRYRSELERGLSAVDSAVKAVSTTGRGIVFNALSVITGFSVLLFSGFTSIRFFGYLVIISIGVCLISALVSVPAIFIMAQSSGLRAQGSGLRDYSITETN